MGKTTLMEILANPPGYLVDAVVSAVEEAGHLESLWTFLCAQLLRVGPFPPKSTLVPLQSSPTYSVCVTLRGALRCTIQRGCACSLIWCTDPFWGLLASWPYYYREHILLCVFGPHLESPETPADGEGSLSNF